LKSSIDKASYGNLAQKTAENYIYWIILFFPNKFIKKLSTFKKLYFYIKRSYTRIYPHYPQLSTTIVA